VPTDRRNLVFISYSQLERRWVDRLLVYLKPYIRGALEVWDDHYIQVGDRWERNMEEALPAVLLASADFLASDFIHDCEFPALRAAEEAGAASERRSNTSGRVPPGQPSISSQKVEQDQC